MPARPSAYHVPTKAERDRLRYCGIALVPGARVFFEGVDLAADTVWVKTPRPHGAPTCLKLPRTEIAKDPPWSPPPELLAGLERRP